MCKIKILDGETINKIAAGEVVERPSSVVKELVENAIDAGASAITIEIQDGGTTLIRITDNGMGFEKEEIPIAFLRHSTSKIRDAKDLDTIGSLGFRGEALSSISAVSQVELLTKTRHALTGCRYRIEGGTEVSMEDIGCPDGTTLIIRQIFYNTPARKKFLKSNMTEAGYINDLIQRLAMSHPEISFKFINNRQHRLNTSGNGKLKEILYHIYGKDISSNLLEIHTQAEGIEMTGYIGKPIICRGNRSYENYFINGRYVKSGIITQAIEDAFKTFTMVHKFPFAVLHFKLDPQILDVNVHPTKMEVRISNGQQLYQMIYDHLRQALLGRELIPEVKYEEPKPILPKTETPTKMPSKAMEPKVNSPIEPLPKPRPIPPEPFEKKRKEVPVIKEKPIQYELFDTGLLKPESKKRHKLIGQLFETYWIIEFDEKMFIVDQHAAHEKVLYEKLMTHYKSHAPMTQMVHPPMILSLSLREIELLNKYMDAFHALGFEFEAFGGNEFALRGIPSDLYGMTGKEMILQFLDELSEDYERFQGDLISDRIATMACKAAVKGNMRLSFREADALIEALLNAENPYTCPHGRPTIISMSKTELEKKFKRIV